MKRSVLALGAALMIVGAAQAQEAKPKVFVGATVVSQNADSITIRYSAVGEQKAKRMAADHCAKFDRYAEPTSSSPGRALADSTRTWACRATELGSN